jgi:heme/copper-type cytochrome/quinol oxidase subunit 3
MAHEAMTPPPVLAGQVDAGHSEAAHGHDIADTRKAAMWLFLISEVMFFTVLIIGMIMARVKDPDPHHVLNVPLSSLNTFILLCSSVTVVFALSSIQQGRRVRFLRFIAISIAFGAIFVALQGVEYFEMYHEGVRLDSSLFGSAFFALTGFHGAHVIIGVAWLIRIFLKGFNGDYGPNNYWGIEMAGLYWHFVDVVWIVLFTLIYLF